MITVSEYKSPTVGEVDGRHPAVPTVCVEDTSVERDIPVPHVFV